MTVIAELRLSSDELPLMAALSPVPDLELTVEQAVATDPSKLRLFLWAAGDDFERFETGLDGDETVLDYTVLDDLSERKLYRVAVSPEANVVLYPISVEIGATQLSVVATHRGLRVRMRFQDRESLKEFQSRCRDADVAVELRQLYRSGGTDEEASFGLSKKQRQTLTKAVALGFFKVPRETSLDGLAEKLDVSNQATSERIRRATETLVRSTIGIDG
ncbi:helix-turn-helix domain-containing protein [Haladaptatus sp. DYSN1]|uniref:helix-turn-helix domain-containing protein n=1 Tax=unclassified Haladaptatus TaxID=2622732 RepID=UPI002406ACA2|nr:helix-turn-helix domain-containing protein [Haladaptatus sp. DYSN1]